MAQKNRVPRVLLTKSELDHHDRGVMYVAQLLRDNKMEVIYTSYGTPEDIVAIATQEAVDVIGLSFFSGGQVRVTERVVELLKEQSMGDLPIFVGGTIRPFDEPKLLALNVKGIFRGGEPLDTFVSDIQEIVNPQQ